MNVMPGGLAGAIGALHLDGARAAGPAGQPRSAGVDRSSSVTASTSTQRPTGGFENGLFEAKAVNAPAKSAATQTPPNPNLPRGSLIDLRI